jgi:hypothetical protein
MMDVTGQGCNKSYAPVRNDLPLHDFTGGNTFIPLLIDSVYPGEANLVALQAGIDRARDMLQHSATVNLYVDADEQEAEVEVINETGHKLPSGYPEGRRIWINLKAWNTNTSDYYESGAYDTLTGILTTSGTKIYQIKPGLSPGLAAALGLTAGVSFHFVLNDTIYSDNRIPPRGFTNANFEAIQSPPVGYEYDDGEYWDETHYDLPFSPNKIEVSLLYQTTSKEYVEFLRDENVTNNAGQVMYDLWNNNGKSPPELMNFVTWTLSNWTGSVDSDWYNPLNWDNDVPLISSDVVIPGSVPNMPVISGSAECNNVTIENGGQLTVSNGGILTINGKVIEEGGNNAAAPPIIDKGIILGGH